MLSGMTVGCYAKLPFTGTTPPWPTDESCLRQKCNADSGCKRRHRWAVTPKSGNERWGSFSSYQAQVSRHKFVSTPEGGVGRWRGLQMYNPFHESQLRRMRYGHFPSRSSVVSIFISVIDLMESCILITSIINVHPVVPSFISSFPWLCYAILVCFHSCGFPLFHMQSGYHSFLPSFRPPFAHSISKFKSLASCLCLSV